MAITIQDSPINYSPAYSPCIYVIDEPTLATENEFKYITEIYSDGQKKAELKSFPHPVYKWGKFDIQTIVQNLLEERIDFESGVFSSAESIEQIQARFGYEYINSSGSFVRVENDLTDTQFYFNGSPFYREFVDLRESDPNHPRVITSGTGYEKYPLTTRKLIETADDTKQWLYYISSDYTNISSIQITNNETSVTDTIPLPTALQNNFDGKMVAFRVDRGFVEANTTHTDLKLWSVRTLDNLSNPTSEWTYLQKLPCSRNDLYSLYYLNRWGGIDSMSMDGRSTTQVSTESRSYKSDTERVNSSGVVNYNTDRHAVRNFWTESTTQLQLTSQWIDYSTKVSAIDLRTSPLVWMEDKDGVIIPVNVVEEEFVIQNRSNTEPIMINMTVQYQQPNKRQRV